MPKGGKWKNLAAVRLPLWECATLRDLVQRASHSSCRVPSAAAPVRISLAFPPTGVVQSPFFQGVKHAS